MFRPQEEERDYLLDTYDAIHQLAILRLAQACEFRREEMRAIRCMASIHAAGRSWPRASGGVERTDQPARGDAASGGPGSDVNVWRWTIAGASPLRSWSRPRMRILPWYLIAFRALAPMHGSPIWTISGGAALICARVDARRFCTCGSGYAAYGGHLKCWDRCFGCGLAKQTAPIDGICQEFLSVPAAQ